MAQTAIAAPQLKKISVRIEYVFWARLKKSLAPEHGALNRRMRELILMELGELPAQLAVHPGTGKGEVQSELK